MNSAFLLKRPVIWKHPFYHMSNFYSHFYKFIRIYKIHKFINLPEVTYCMLCILISCGSPSQKKSDLLILIT